MVLFGFNIRNPENSSRAFEPGQDASFPPLRRSCLVVYDYRCIYYIYIYICLLNTYIYIPVCVLCACVSIIGIIYAYLTVYSLDSWFFVILLVFCLLPRRTASRHRQEIFETPGPFNSGADGVLEQLLGRWRLSPPQIPQARDDHRFQDAGD